MSRLRSLAAAGFAFLAFVSTLALSVRLYLQQKIDIGFWFNADALSLPAITKDLFFEGGSFRNWNANPAPDFIFDWPLYAVANFFSPDVYLGWPIFYVLQSLLTVIALYLVLREFLDAPTSAAWALAANSWHLLFSSLALSPFLLTIVGGFHYNLIILLLFWLKAVFRLQDRDPLNFLGGPAISVFILTVISVASDRLFVVHAVVPVLFLAVIAKLRKLSEFSSKFVFLSKILLAGTLCGAISSKLLVAHSHSYSYKLRLRDFFNNIGMFFESFADLLKPSLHGVFEIVFILAFSGFCLVRLRNYFRERNRQFSKTEFLVFFAAASAFVTCSVLILGNTGFLARYAMTLYILPIFLLPVALRRWSKNYYLLCLIGACLYPPLALAYESFQRPAPVQWSYTSPTLDCIEQTARKEGLNSGIAQYWMTKPLRLLTKLDIAPYRMEQGQFQYFNWSGRVDWERASYDFAIISTGEVEGSYYRLDEAKLKEFTGEPRRTVMCGTEKVLIYDKSGMRVPPFKGS